METPTQAELPVAKNVYNQISERLVSHGLQPESNDVDKLLFLWKLHVHVEEELQQARKDQEKLKETQAGEMKEVETYIEHIRQLSDEREGLIQELEVENEALKLQVLTLEQEGSGAAQAEITEMLTQQGLTEIANAMQSEQIAYLLMERARLLHDLDEHRNNSKSDTEISGSSSSNVDFKSVLERERKEFEEELSQQREKAKMMSEQLQHEHEEEISALMDENGKLEEDLQKAEMMVSQLKAELSKYTEGDNMAASLNQSMKTVGEEERRKLIEERHELDKQQGKLKNYMEEIEKDREELKTERDNFEHMKAIFEQKRSSFDQEKLIFENLKIQIEEEKIGIEQAKAALQKENQVLAQKILESEKRTSSFDSTTEGEVSQDQEVGEKEGVRKRGSLSRSPSDLTLRKIIEDKTKVESEVVQLKAQLRVLQKEKDSLENMVAKLKEDLDKSVGHQQQLQIKNRSLKEELQDLEDQLDETEAKLDSITKEKQSLSEKFDKLNSEVKTLRADAIKSNTLQDIVEILNNDKRQLTQSLESLKNQIEQAESEKNHLASQNNCLSKGEQDLTNQLKHCQDELERAISEKHHLENEKHELLTIVKKQEDAEKMLTSDLEEVNKMKEKYSHQVESLGKENKDLLNQLDKTREDLETAKLQLQELAKQEQVMKHLKEDNQKLQGQVSMIQEQLDRSRDREAMLISTQQAIQRNQDGAEKRYLCEIDDLKTKLELAVQELARARDKVGELHKEKVTLTENVQKMEQLLQESSKVKAILEEEKIQKNKLKMEVSSLELELSKKTALADKYLEERRFRMDLESRVEVLKSMEETIKTMTTEAEQGRTERQALEDTIEDLRKVIDLQVSQVVLASAQEATDEERQLCQILELKVTQLEKNVADVAASRALAVQQLESDRKLRLDMEGMMRDLQTQLAHNQVSGQHHAEAREQLVQESAALEESKKIVKQLTERLENEGNQRRELADKITELEQAFDATNRSSLQDVLLDLEQEKSAKAECELRLLEIEQLLEDKKVYYDNLHHDLTDKIVLLESKVQTLEQDLVKAQVELQAFQEKAVKEAEVTRREVMGQSTQKDTFYEHKSGRPASPSCQGEDQESLFHSVSVKLQEKLNELNTLKSRQLQQQEQLESSLAEANCYRQELVSLEQSHDAMTKQLEASDERIKSLRHELAEAQGILQFTQNQLKEKQLKLESVTHDRDEIRRELDTVREKLLKQISQHSHESEFYGEKERQKHTERASVLEKLSQQLELDNREMSRKLADTLRNCETLEEQLQKEKHRTADSHQQRHRYISQLEKDVETANCHIRHLREELQKHQTIAYRLEADNLGLSAKYQSTIARLEQEIKDLKHRHEQDVASLRERVSTSSSEHTELRAIKRELEQELSRLRLEISRLKLDNSRLEKHLEAECKIKLGLENRNSAIDGEITKTMSQVRNLMGKNTELESANHSLEQELTLAKSALRHMETNLTQKEAMHEANTTAIQSRAELAERKARHLQQQVEEVTNKMLNVEKQLAHADLGSVQLQDVKDTLLAVRHQLEGEKLQRSILDQTVAELKHQVALLKQTELTVRNENKQLQHTILDLESHLKILKDKNEIGVNMRQHMAEVGRDSLLDQISRLQNDIRDLQLELSNMSDRRDVDMKRYEERKLRTKAKLMKARALYTAERTRYMEHIKNMEEDLRLTHATLAKEKDWAKKIDENYKLLLREKRNLITQLSEVEESLRDRTQSLSMVQAKVTYLEAENSRLQSHMQVVMEEKQNLNKQLQMHHIAEATFRMPAMNLSVKPSQSECDSIVVQDSGNQQDILDQPWPSHIEPPANFRRASVASDASSRDRSDHVIVGDITDNRQSTQVTQSLRTPAQFIYAGSAYSLHRDSIYDDGDEFEA